MFSCHLWMMFNIMFYFNCLLFWWVLCWVRRSPLCPYFWEWSCSRWPHSFHPTWISDHRSMSVGNTCIFKKKKKKSESPVHNVRSFSIYTSPLMTQEHVFISVSRSFSYFVRCVYKLCYSMSSHYFLLLIYMLKLFNLFLRDMLIISFSRIV